MLWVPHKGVPQVQHNTGAVGTVNIGTAVTTGASSNTKGTPAELITSTNFDAYWVRIMCCAYGLSATASDGCLDILAGASTEEVIIPNLLMGYSPDPTLAQGFKTWDFPLYIPAGTRIAAQAAGLRTATAFRVAIFLYGGDGCPAFPVGQKVTTYGIGTVPNGTSVTPGASGAEGSWTQIVASTSEDHFAIVPSFQAINNSGMLSRMIAMDIGVGAATEEEIAQSIWWAANGLEYIVGPANSMPCFQSIPAGSRLSTRLSNNNTTPSYDVALHCVS